MKILLINNNPVVSRLTALSARKENISLDEIKNISELKASDYNIIFVDGESYNNDVSNIIRNSGVEKRVLFYAQGEEQNQSIFTQSILKPFLPSEVSEILRETKVTLLKSKKEEPKENINFQDLVEESKEKELEFLNIMEEKEPTVALASSTVASAVSDKKTIEENIVKKDIIEKDEFDLKIEEAFALNLDENKEKKRVEKEPESHKKDMFDLDSDLFELDTKKESNPETKENELFELDDKKKSLKEGFEENIFDENLFELDKEMKKDILNDLPLDFDIESKDEVGFSTNTPKIEEEPKIEKAKQKVEEKKVKEDIKMTEKSEVTTKVLNNEDIADIMDILDEKEGSEKLTEIPTSLKRVQESVTEKSVDTKKSIDTEEILKQEVSEKKEIIEEKKTQEKEIIKKEIQKEEIASDDLSTGVAIADRLSRLPIKELRELLRGAKVNISIEFSNKI